MRFTSYASYFPVQDCRLSFLKLISKSNPRKINFTSVSPELEGLSNSELFTHRTSSRAPVPTFNKKSGKNEYFVLARPPDAGNITYQVAPGAKELLKNLDYRDGDDLPWGIVKPLRIAGLLHTKGEGPTPDIDEQDLPQLDPSELEYAGADEKETVLDFLESQNLLSGAKLEEIREYFGVSLDRDLQKRDVDAMMGDFQGYEELIKSEFQNSDLTLTNIHFKVKDLGFALHISTSEKEASTPVVELRQITSELGSGVDHTLRVVEDRPWNSVSQDEVGIDEWVVKEEGELTWQNYSEVYRSIGQVLQVLDKSSQVMDFPLGDPDEIPYFGPDVFHR